MGGRLGMTQQAYALLETRRSPTKVHAAAVRMLVVLHIHELSGVGILKTEAYATVLGRLREWGELPN